MENKSNQFSKTLFGAKLTQIAWVSKDIKVAEKFFQETMGLYRFSPVQTMRLNEFEATHYGEQSNAESLVTIAYTGELFVELIQPLSGISIFQDYLDRNPSGGIQHLAYSTPVSNLDNVILEMKNKGFDVITRVNHPIANIVFFDTSEEIGVFTEIMGITPEGEMAVQEMKASLSQ